MHDIIEMMQDIGFSVNEAKVYVALTIKNPMTGYEIAKNSEITRTMVYDILKRLVNKGAVNEIESNTKLYSPVPYKELFEKYKDEYTNKIRRLETEMDKIESKSESDNYLININGYEDMTKEIRDMIQKAKSEIYLSIWEQEAMIFKEDLKAAYDRGVNIISFSYSRLPYDFGTIYEYGLPQDVVRQIWERRRLVVVVDREHILIGEGNEKIEEISVITSNTMLIELAIDQLILDIIHLTIIQNNKVIPDNIQKKKDYEDNMTNFYKKLGIDFEKFPRRVEQD